MTRYTLYLDECGSLETDDAGDLFVLGGLLVPTSRLDEAAIGVQLRSAIPWVPWPKHRADIGLRTAHLAWANNEGAPDELRALREQLKLDGDATSLLDGLKATGKVSRSNRPKLEQLLGVLPADAKSALYAVSREATAQWQRAVCTAVREVLAQGGLVVACARKLAIDADRTAEPTQVYLEALRECLIRAVDHIWARDEVATLELFPMQYSTRRGRPVGAADLVTAVQEALRTQCTDDGHVLLGQGAGRLTVTWRTPALNDATLHPMHAAADTVAMRVHQAIQGTAANRSYDDLARRARERGVPAGSAAIRGPTYTCLSTPALFRPDAMPPPIERGWSDQQAWLWHPCHAKQPISWRL